MACIVKFYNGKNNILRCFKGHMVLWNTLGTNFLGLLSGGAIVICPQTFNFSNNYRVTKGQGHVKGQKILVVVVT